MHPRRRTITALAALSATCLCAQDVEQVAGDVKKTLKDPVTVAGSLGASSVFYRSYGIQPRRDPFYWVMNANLTISVLDKVTIPFSAVITQQDKNFTNGLDKFSQPFNQFGISPRYRWLTVHAGYRTMDFSEYTLSGVIWLGGGVEIVPQRSLVSGSAFYGRFLKAVPKGGVDGIVVSLPAYERRGGGARLRVGTDATYGQLVFMKIADDPASIPFDTALLVTPHENQLMAITARHGFTRWLSVQGEMALSMFTRNLFQETYSPAIPYASDYFMIRPSTRFNKVINASIDFAPGRQRFAIRYKRVDPDYQSLGAIFLTNDVEELSASSDLVTGNGKVAVSVASGVQRNNLDSKQAVSSNRLIGSANVSYNVSEHISLNGSYSNFSSNSVARRDVFTDSILFVQVTQNGALNANFAFGGSCRQMVSAMVNYQESVSSQQPVTTFATGSLCYNLSIGESGWNMGVSALVNRMYNEIMGEQVGAGPQVSMQKSFLRGRLRCSLSGGRQENFLNNLPGSQNLTTSAGINFALDSHQQLRADGSFLARTAAQPGIQSFSEIRILVGYAYQFRVSRKKKGGA